MAHAGPCPMREHVERLGPPRPGQQTGMPRKVELGHSRVYRRGVKIAIVGSGIAGLAAADALAGRFSVTLYEAAPRAGGHVYTVAADGHSIDMGFIVCNR